MLDSHGEEQIIQEVNNDDIAEEVNDMSDVDCAFDDSLIGLLLNISGKTKDGVNARRDLVDMNIRIKLAPKETDKRRTYLPPACYTLSKAERNELCQSLHGVKVPFGYSANIKKLVSMQDLKLIGMKSHDCHVLMTQMLCENPGLFSL